MVRPLPGVRRVEHDRGSTLRAVRQCCGKKRRRKDRRNARSVPKPVAQLDDEEEIRFSTGMAEMDRVLGGGAVRGSLVLVGGAPGIGKSTLLLQICGNIPDAKILYVTGEESQRQP